jgi:hypothetical protein
MVSQVVYTALFGETEALVEQEVAKRSSIRFVCFTDNPNLVSSTWEIVLVSPLFAADPRRSQRDIKIRGHESLSTYEQWLYIDNTVRLKKTPEEILGVWLKDADWAALSHDANSTLWAEFEANLALSKETPERLNEQLHDYSTHHPDVLDQRPLWNGFFARKNSPAVTKFADLWFSHVLRYSARDQLSILVALDREEVSLKRVAGRVRNSQWHDWPHRNGETVTSKATRHARRTGLKSVAEELHDRELEVQRLSAELNGARGEIRRLTNLHWFGLVGLARIANSIYRSWRKRRKQEQKRR